MTVSPGLITNKHLPRRTILRGLGAAIALPFLDAMVPAFGAVSRAAARPVRRLGAIYVPNGMNMARWTPAVEGAGFQMPPILEPLAPTQDRLIVVSGLANREALQRPGEGGGEHSRSASAFLTGVHSKKTEGADIRNGVSLDQIAAQELGHHTQLASLELGLEANELAGGCEQGYSCAYSGTISWRTPTTPLPMENNPRAVFERLFGATDSTDPEARRARHRLDSSILDMVTGEIGRLEQRLGTGDRAKLTEYVQSVRDIERRIKLAEEQGDLELPDLDRPSGVPASFEEHAKLMFDLMLVAYQTDLTRVCTFMYGREKSSRTYPQIGVPEPHHPVSHHQQRPEALEKLARVNTLHIEMFAYFAEKLRATPDGDGTLLDHVAILYGAGMSDSDTHMHTDIPMLLVGGAGRLKGGRHIRLPEDDETPLANLYLTVLDKLGLPLEGFGDSTGQLPLVSEV